MVIEEVIQAVMKEISYHRYHGKLDLYDRYWRKMLRRRAVRVVKLIQEGRGSDGN
jgi:hypothetical protein